MTDNREKMLDKIKALLSKTTENGCTEEEELAALAKARALMDAYEVTEADLQLTKDQAAILREEPPGTEDPHGIKFSLSYAVAKFTDCRVWRQHRRKGGGLVACGLPADARFATWLLDHLTGFVQAELANYLMGSVATGMARRRAINGFVIGVTERISERLIELCKPAVAATANSRALVITKHQVIKSKLDELGITLCSRSSPLRQHDSGSHDAGRSVGDRASFGRPVRARKLLLGIYEKQAHDACRAGAPERKGQERRSIELNEPARMQLLSETRTERGGSAQ
jgi:hypothetical protein